MKRGMKHQNAPYLSAVNVQKLKLRKDIILRLCHKPYTGIYRAVERGGGTRGNYPGARA